MLVAVHGEFTDNLAMKINWLAATILTLLVFLVPPATPESQAGAAMQTSEASHACERDPASARCCDCCLACDAVAVEGICSSLCAATAAVPVSTSSIAGPRSRRSPWPRAAGWAHHANPPEPYPPRRAFLV